VLDEIGTSAVDRSVLTKVTVLDIGPLIFFLNFSGDFKYLELSFIPSQRSSMLS
jgi:hypothetical protein